MTRRSRSATALPPPLAARLYARTSGCLFLVAAVFDLAFFTGLAYVGINASVFLVPTGGIAVLSLLLLTGLGLRLLLPVAILISLVSTVFWLAAAFLSSGFDWGAFVVQLAPAFIGGLVALRGYLFVRRSPGAG